MSSFLKWIEYFFKFNDLEKFHFYIRYNDSN